MPPWLADWRSTARTVERWLLPAECLLCQEAVGAEAGDPLICGICRSRWRRLPDPVCSRCGQPIDGVTDCRVCREWPEGFSGVASAVWLDDSARRAVHLLKYGGWRRIAAPLALAMNGLSPLRARPVLVPIPLGNARLAHRGYNQSAELAHALAQQRGLLVLDGLTRTRQTQTQTALTPEEREANLRGAFAARGPVPRVVALVDDVFTTGATLVAAAGELLRAGAQSVSGVTFGRAEPPLAAVSRAV